MGSSSRSTTKRAASTDPERLRRRGQEGLIGVALAFSGVWSRARVREIAARSNRRWDDQLTRLATGRMRPFEVEGELPPRCILAPLHFGDYRFVPALLTQRGVPVALLAAQAETPTTQTLYPAVYGGEAAADGGAARYRVVPSESPVALWTLRRALDEGRTVVLYPDGNQGQGGRRPGDRCARVPLWGQSVGVRSGVAALSLASGRPIVPAIVRGDRPARLCLADPLVAERGEPREAFERRVLTAVFAALEAEARRVPHRWEAWPFLSQWVDRTPRPLTERPEVRLPPLDTMRARRLTLRNPHVWPIDLAGTPYVIDLSTWNSLGADRALVALVDAAERGATVAEWVATAPPKAPVAEMLRRMVALDMVGL